MQLSNTYKIIYIFIDINYQSLSTFCCYLIIFILFYRVFNENLIKCFLVNC